MPKKIVIANWKMNPATLKEAEKLVKGFLASFSAKKIQVIICPPFVYLEKLKNIFRKISWGVQNVSCEESGAYTGEISAEMLYNLGTKYVLVGHSERRGMGETNEDVNKKIKACLALGLIPILCVGENERDENHAYLNFVKNQVLECLAGVNKNLFPKIILAYEPIWSISTTINHQDATPADSLEMTIFIRKILSDLSSPKIAGEIKIIYGGSVQEKNVGDFLKNGGVDGVLVGKASLDVKKFTEIVNIAENL